MDSLCKEIMKFMQKNGDDTAFSCSISNDWDDYADARFDELVAHTKENPETVLSAISYLVDGDWLEYAYIGDCNPIGIRMTHRGLHQKEIERQEKISFVMKSILVPVLVSVLTSAVVTFAAYLWTQSGISTYKVSQHPNAEPTQYETVQVATSCFIRK